MGNIALIILLIVLASVMGVALVKFVRSTIKDMRYVAQRLQQTNQEQAEMWARYVRSAYRR